MGNDSGHDSECSDVNFLELQADLLIYKFTNLLRRFHCKEAGRNKAQCDDSSARHTHTHTDTHSDTRDSIQHQCRCVHTR